MVAVTGTAKPTTLSKARPLTGFFGVSLYRNSVFLILNALAPAMTGFLFWILATRLYPTVSIGIASALISAMTLLMFLATFGLDFALVRFLPEAGKAAGRLVTTCFLVSAAVAGGLAAGFILVARLWLPSLSVAAADPALVLAFAAATAIFCVYSLAHHVFIASRRSGLALSQTLVFSVTRFLPLLALAVMMPASGIFISWAIGMAAALSLSLAFLLPRLGIHRDGLAFQPRLLRGMVGYSIGNLAANLLWMSPGLLLPLLVISLLGAEANAHFAVGWAVASIILLAPMGVSMSLFAEGSNQSEQLASQTGRGAGLMIAVIAVAIAVALVAGGGVLRVFGEAYARNSAGLLKLLAISGAPACLNYLFVSVSRVQKRMRGVLLLSGFVAVTTLSLAFYLMPVRGLEGVGLAHLIAQAAPFPLVSISLLRRLTGTAPAVEPEYGDFVEGARVSKSDHEQHLGRYRFAARFAARKRCLDIGCGTGYGAAYFARCAGEVIGGDISDTAVAIARRQHCEQANLVFQEMDAAALPFPDASFDMVSTFEVIEHVRDGEKLLAEVGRVLKPGGVVVLSTPNRSAGPFLFRTSWRLHLKEYRVAEFRRLVEKQFGQCGVYGQDFLSRGDLASRRLRQTAGRLLEVMGLRGLAQRLGRVLFKHNRLVVFRGHDFEQGDARDGEVRPAIPGRDPSTIVVVARK